MFMIWWNKLNSSLGFSLVIEHDVISNYIFSDWYSNPLYCIQSN
jgi:hypothetical protein